MCLIEIRYLITVCFLCRPIPRIPTVQQWWRLVVVGEEVGAKLIILDRVINYGWISQERGKTLWEVDWVLERVSTGDSTALNGFPARKTVQRTHK